MKKEIIIVSIIVIVIIVIDTISQKKLSNVADNINNQLEDIIISLKRSFKNDEIEYKDIVDKIKKASNDWDEWEKTLSLYIEHDELEKVDRSIVIIKSNIENSNYEDIESDLKECIYILNHIKNKQSLSLYNLF